MQMLMAERFISAKMMMERLSDLTIKTGKELDKAILKSQGRTWDGMPIPKLQIADLRGEAIDLFKEKSSEKA